jgi:hypothetical protein
VSPNMDLLNLVMKPKSILLSPLLPTLSDQGQAVFPPPNPVPLGHQGARLVIVLFSVSCKAIPSLGMSG